MSQVHSVTHVRYTHPLARLVYLVRAQRGMIRVGVAGRNGPLRRVAQESTHPQRGRIPPPTTVKAIFPVIDPALPHGGWLSWVRETNRAIEIQAVESPRNETRRSDVFRGRPADCCLTREGVSGGQYRADRSLLGLSGGDISRFRGIGARSYKQTRVLISAKSPTGRTRFLVSNYS